MKNLLRGLLQAVAIGLTSMDLSAAEVFLKDGDAYFRPSLPDKEAIVRLTNTQDVHRADLVPGGRWVLHYTMTTGMTLGSAQAHFIRAYLIRTDGKARQLLWSASPMAPHGYPWDKLIPAPAFTPDARALYYVDNGQIRRFDFDKGISHPVCPGFGVDIVPTGTWAGYPAILKESPEGRVQQWLVNPDGQSLQLLDPDAKSPTISAKTLERLNAEGNGERRGNRSK